MTEILKVLVGSQAHGLATEISDRDYRGVFVVPTAEILSLEGSRRHTSWLEGDVDDTAWEIGRFLKLATHCNPSILEAFLAPVVSADAWGEEIRSLFPSVWNSLDVRNAFIGYGLNQRKKFLDSRDRAPHKFAVAYLRTLYQACELLTTGTFTVRVADTEIGDKLKRWKQGDYTIGEVIESCWVWENLVRKSFDEHPAHEPNLDAVTDFLLRLRRAFW